MRTATTKSVLGVPLVAALVAGCFPATHLKTGDVTPPGRIAFGAGALILDGEAGPIMLEARYGLFPGLDVGTRWDFLAYCADIRVQPLRDDHHGIDLALDVGVGWAAGVLPKPLVYGGLTVSKGFGKWTPYFHFRYIDLLLQKSELDDEDDSNIVADLLFYVPAELQHMTQYVIGFQYAPVPEPAPKFGFLVEALVMPELEDAAGHPLTFVNAGVRFRFW